jgi:predicted amidohydrolase
LTNWIIQHINIIDVVNGIVLPNEEVVIKDRLIYFIGNSFSEKTASDTKFIDGKGKYLLPGFWDMHFHLCWQEGNDALLFPALLKKGITGIRDMGGDLNMMQQFKTKLKKWRNHGPEIFGAGPIIDGNPPVHSDFHCRLMIKRIFNSFLIVEKW